jgi:hypothetical protein
MAPKLALFGWSKSYLNILLDGMDVAMDRSVVAWPQPIPSAMLFHQWKSNLSGARNVSYAYYQRVSARQERDGKDTCTP